MIQKYFLTYDIAADALKTILKRNVRYFALAIIITHLSKDQVVREGLTPGL